MGKDLAPRVAARLGVGLASDCTALAVEGGKLVATRPVFAGKAIQTLAFPQIAGAGVAAAQGVRAAAPRERRAAPS